MKNKITMTQMMAGTNELKKQGKHFTHLGVGPMSYNLLRASLELAKEKGIENTSKLTKSELLKELED